MIPLTTTHCLEADGIDVFYREAGAPGAPVILMLHGFPSSSFQFRELIPRLASAYRVIASDLPDLGYERSRREEIHLYFRRPGRHNSGIHNALKLDRYVLYVFDYGAPTGFRLAMAHPERIVAIVSKNGNAYEEGLGDAWAPIQRYWQYPSAENRETLRLALDPAGLRSQ